MRGRPLVAPALALVLALAAAGCGLGAGDKASGVSLTVTRDFGTQKLGDVKREETAGGETVMRLLQRSFDVDTRHGGGFVQSIDGLSGGNEGGRPIDWFYYVNGIEAEVGAAERKLEEGDRVVWDRHDWGAAARVPAIVGSFPEPFLSGEEGRRYPTRVDCASDAREACDGVRKRLEAAGIRQTSLAGLRQAAGIDTLRLVVGEWRDVRTDPVVERIARGPKLSGVYVRFDEQGTSFDVLDARGRPVQKLAAGAGLIAATRYGEQKPTWVVTGTDKAGVARAVKALEEGVLGAHFALAISADDRAVPAPAVAVAEAR